VTFFLITLSLSFFLRCTLVVDAVNDAPTITTPSSLQTYEDVAVSLADVVVDDVDADEASGAMLVATRKSMCACILINSWVCVREYMC
jgi:hypothetical protein